MNGTPDEKYLNFIYNRCILNLFQIGGNAKGLDMTQHTKTPFSSVYSTTSDKEPRTLRHYIIGSNGNNTVAYMNVDTLCDDDAYKRHNEQCRADFAFIVSACNCHDELVGTINQILQLIGNVDHSIGNGAFSAQMRGELLNDIRLIAQEAIQKAKGDI